MSVSTRSIGLLRRVSRDDVLIAQMVVRPAFEANGSSGDEEPIDLELAKINTQMNGRGRVLIERARRNSVKLIGRPSL